MAFTKCPWVFRWKFPAPPNSSNTSAVLCSTGGALRFSETTYLDSASGNLEVWSCTGTGWNTQFRMDGPFWVLFLQGLLTKFVKSIVVGGIVTIGMTPGPCRGLCLGHSHPLLDQWWMPWESAAVWRPRRWNIIWLVVWNMGIIIPTD